MSPATWMVSSHGIAVSHGRAVVTPFHRVSDPDSGTELLLEPHVRTPWLVVPRIRVSARRALAPEARVRVPSGSAATVARAVHGPRPPTRLLATRQVDRTRRSHDICRCSSL